MTERIEYCPGSGDDEEGWREGCEDCARRTAPSGDSKGITPPLIITFWCEYHIPAGADR